MGQIRKREDLKRRRTVDMRRFMGVDIHKTTNEDLPLAIREAPELQTRAIRKFQAFGRD